MGEHFGPKLEVKGAFGISNHPQHLPYRKSEAGRLVLEQEVLTQGLEGDELLDRLEKMMTCRIRHWPDPQIREQDQGGKGDAVVEHFSSVFVNGLSSKGY